MNEKLRLIVDGAGRYILGVIINNDNDDDMFYVVKNPALIVVNTGVNGQIQIQTIPFFFRELTKNTDDTFWYFSKSVCAIAMQIELNDQLIQQYINATSQKQTELPKTVKLFDE